METLKKYEKDGVISQDMLRDWSDAVQKLTDGYIKKVDEALAAKEADIKQP
jgi:ribosome recycling factor